MQLRTVFQLPTASKNGTYSWQLTSTHGAKLYMWDCGTRAAGTSGITLPLYPDQSTLFINNDKGLGQSSYVSAKFNMTINTARSYCMIMDYYSNGVTIASGNLGITYQANGTGTQTAPVAATLISPANALTSTSWGARGSISFQYYTGTWGSLPNWIGTAGVTTGTCPGFDLWGSCKQSGVVAMGYAFWAQLTVPTSADWTFYLGCDDGCKLTLWAANTSQPNYPTINNDGSHAIQELSSTLTLTAGVYWLTVLYYNSVSTFPGMYLNVSWSSTGYPKQTIPSSALSTRPFTLQKAPVIFQITPWQFYTPGNVYITLTGYNFAADDGTKDPPIIQLRDPANFSDVGTPCVVRPGWNDSFVACLLPTGQGTPLLEMWQPLFNGLIPMKYLPRWPEDTFFWVWQPQNFGTNCVKVGNLLIPSNYAWEDNYFCTDSSKADIKQTYNSQQLTVPAGYRCVPFNNPLQNNGNCCTDNVSPKSSDSSKCCTGAWNNAKYCLPTNSPYNVQLSCNGPVAGKSCISVREGSDPYWSPGLCFFCADVGTPYGGGLYQLYAYSPPQVDSVTPNHGPTVGGTRLTITGNSFGIWPGLAGGFVVGYKDCAIADGTWNHTYFECTLPSGEGINSLTLTVSGLVNQSTIQFTYDAPILNYTSPSTYYTSGNIPLTIFGKNFGTTPGTVTIDALNCPVTSWKDTNITCTLPAAQGTGYTIYVSTYWDIDAANTLPWNYLPPNITDWSPKNTDSTGGVTLALTGTSFGTTGTVQVGGVLCVPSFYSHTSILCSLPAGQGVGIPITLQVSGQNQVYIPLLNYNPPVITTVTPLTAGSGLNVFLTLVGTSFGQSGNITVGNQSCLYTAAQYIPGRILCALPNGNGFNVPVNLTVAGQASTPTFYFSYFPTITAISSPSGFPTAGGVSVTITGTSYAASVALTAVTLNGTQCSVSSSSSSSIVFALPAGQGVNLPVIVYINGTSSNTWFLTYDPPIINVGGVVPSTGASPGGYNVTISGVNFAPSPLPGVTIGLSNCPVKFANFTVIICVAPPGLGPTNGVIVSVADVPSNSVNFGYNPPNITKINPDHGGIDGGYLVTLTGTEFAAAGVVTVGAVTISMTPINLTTIIFTMPKGEGTPTILVKIASQSSNVQTFTYDSPVIYNIDPKNSTTAGGDMLAVYGINFGSTAKVYVGGALCVQGPGKNSSYFPCTIPVGSGKNQTVQVNDLKFSNIVFFDYLPPKILFLTPNHGPTGGSDSDGKLLQITGQSFGTSGTVLVGGQPCSTQNGIYSHTVIQCSVPPGQGSVALVSITVTGQTSNTAEYKYDLPEITNIIPSHGPTTGGTIIGIYGTNFGLNASITVAGLPCISTGFTQSHVQYECTTNPGQGLSIPVYIQVGDQQNLIAYNWNYDAPTITSISPLHGPTVGGINITVNGQNFGTGDQPYSLTFDGNDIAFLFIGSGQNQMIFVLPPGTGVNKSISYSVAGQSVTADSNFNYDVPVVYSASGCIDSVYPKAISCKVAGGDILYINGTNFGNKTTGVSATTGGVPCPLISVNESFVTCNLAASPTGGYNLPIQVVIDTQASVPVALVNYNGPIIIDNTLATVAAPAVTGNITVDSTVTPQAITFGGRFWGNDKDIATVTYGFPGQAKNFVCTVTSLTELASQYNTLECTTQAGTGSGLVFQIKVGQITSQEGNDALSYPAPIIADGSLKLGLYDDNSTEVTGTDQKGDRVYFNAENLGTDSSLITVNYGQGTLTSFKPCLSAAIVVGFPSVVTCITQSGFGRDYHFQLFANGAPSNIGTDSYNYVTAPSVTGIIGCTPDPDDSNKTMDCPTKGGRRLTIIGSDFGQQNTSVVIGRNLCPQVIYINFTTLSCMLPEGTGNNLPVSVAVGARLSQPIELVSYISATIDKISGLGSPGCVTSGINVIDCPREGAVNITFEGSNFGPATPTPIIVIGSQACEPVYADPVDPHSRLSCTIPPGALTNVKIAFRQGLGIQLSTVTSTISYQLCPAGAYLAPNHIDCYNCSIGKYGENIGATGSSACSDCEAGKFSNQTGVQSCITCDSGSAALNPGSSNCTACAAGYYANAQGLAACLPCDVGYFTNVTGQTTCGSCSPGTVNTAPHSTGCSQCAKGKFNPYYSAIACIDCPPGTANDQQGAAACSVCKAGNISELSSASLNCVPCVAGLYVATDQQSKCLQCDPGFFSNTSGLANCFSCTPGKFTGNTGSLDCSACDQGKYTVGGGDSYCPPCPEGTFGNATGLSVCYACAPGKYADDPSTTDCSLCAPGLYAPEPGLVSCLRCTPGSIAPGNGSTSCDKCSPGSYQTQSAQTSCVVCPAGQSAAGSGQPICLDCDSGRWSNTTNTTVCPACPAGFYSIKNPDTSLSIRGALSCVKCGLGTYGAFSGMEACDLCAPGFFASTQGLTACKACDPGKATSASGALGCDLCSPGFFSASNGTTECGRCLSGKFSNKTGADSCIPCFAGEYQPQDGLSFCLKCPNGTFASATGSATCTACPSGTFANDTGLPNCYSCDAGKFSGVPQSSGCTPCQPGSVAQSQGQTSCDACQIGSFAFGSGNTLCTSCSPGTYTSTLSSTSCKNCTVGTYAANSGSQLCQNCSVGYFTNVPMSVQCYPCEAGKVQSLVGMASCDSCIPGFAMPLTGQDSCLPCDSGTFTAANGSEVCRKCPPGTFSQTKNGIGSTECTGCGIGLYNGFEGQPECRPCGIGQFSNQTTQTDCQPCGYGTSTAKTGQTACTDCDPGTYAEFLGQAQCFGCKQGTVTTAYGTRFCTPCTPGLYQSAEGQQECIECAVGYFADGNSAVECTICEKGKYGNVTGLPQCNDCDRGSFQSGEGALSCIPCANGTATNNPGSPKCTACTPGLYAPNEGTTECKSCSPGYYNVDENQLQCSACPAGKYQNQEAQEGCIDCASRQIAPNKGSPTCIACQLKSEANYQKTVCECEVGYAERNGTCVACPAGAVCETQGLVWDSLQTQDGWWSRNNSYYRCLQPKNCPGGLGSPCAPNRIGPICAYCMPHYQEVIGGACIPCSSKGGSIGYFIMATFLIVGALYSQFYILLLAGRPLIRVFKEQTKLEEQRLKAFKEGRTVDELDSSRGGAESKGDYSLIEGHSRGLSSSMSDFGRSKAMSAALDPVKHQQHLKEKEERRLRLKYNVNRYGNIITIHGTPTPKAEFTFKLKIVLSFLQIVTELAVGVEIQWPKLFKNFVSFFDPANLDFVQVSSVSCVRHVDYYDKLLTAIVVPPLVCAALIITYFIPKTILARGDPLEAKAVRKKFWKLLLFVLFLIYPYCASTVLRTFICKEVLGTWYLMADMKVECYTPQWYFWTKIAGLMILVYPVGIPAFFFFMLFRYRFPKDRLAEVGVRAQLGFLYDAYQRELWWFEMVDMLHKLLVTSALAFVQPFEAQLPVGILVVFLYLCVILLSKPYLRKSDDRLHLVAQMEILLFLIAGDTFYHAPVPPDSGFDTLMSLVLMTMLILFLAYFVSQAFVGIKKLLQDHKVKAREQQRKKDDEFYGMDGYANLVTEDDKPLKDYETPILLRLLPPSVWQKWPLRKYKKWMPHKKDTGRSFLKGVEWVDRRALQPAPLYHVDGPDDEKVSLEENPISRFSDADKLSIREEARARGPSFGLPIIDESGERRKSESEGAAWADAAPISSAPLALETDDEGGPSSPSSVSGNQQH